MNTAPAIDPNSAVAACVEGYIESYERLTTEEMREELKSLENELAIHLAVEHKAREQYARTAPCMESTCLEGQGTYKVRTPLVPWEEAMPTGMRDNLALLREQVRMATISLSRRIAAEAVLSSRNSFRLVMGNAKLDAS